MKVVLLRVVRTPVLAYVGADEHPIDIGELEKEAVAQVESYLGDLVARMMQQGMEVKNTVPKGLDASRIIDYVQSEDVGMVAMSTNGRSGLGRMVIGSVVAAAIRNLETPVLVVRPPT